MQHNISSMIGYAIRATDGDLGNVDEFYFDDETWTIRYIVVETGNYGTIPVCILTSRGNP